jgi:hypothetical protein
MQIKFGYGLDSRIYGIFEQENYNVIKNNMRLIRLG